MPRYLVTKLLKRTAGRYGMAGVLVLLAGFFCAVTVQEQHPTGAAAGRTAAADVVAGERVLIVAGDDPDGVDFARAAEDRAPTRGRDRGRRYRRFPRRRCVKRSTPPAPPACG